MVFQKRPSSLDPESLYQLAVRALARRARSIGELRQLLAKRKAAMEDIDAVIARLKEHGYLDDARYARAFVASRIENDRQGARRVQRDLGARRVHPDLIQQTIRAAYDDVDERELLRDYLRRKVRLSKPPQKASAVATLYRRLLRAGFSSATIVKELQGLLQSIPRRTTSRGASAAIDPEKWQDWVESLSDVPEPED
ncbi:MAG: RecX family transcriptional regulator [Acidobacteria bacterium]|nr:RecX family transcriptional regulator [Acidobacteriota bacterium]